ncbi:MAG: MBL fold metallo-hydrolase [Solirubrobacterales bacterium]|nr:MBL fold metallo-hydrolase [Solirubrobacterales bacterium]
MTAATEVHRIVGGRLDGNCYVVACDGDAVVLDPGGEAGPVVDRCVAGGLRVHAVLATHGHADHLAAAVEVCRRLDAPFHLHPADAFLLPRVNFYRRFMTGEPPIDVPAVDVELGDGDTLRFGALAVTVVHTPGHTPGGVCLAIGDDVFTGDTLIGDRPGRTDLPGGDPVALARSLGALGRACPPGATIRPGHGAPVPAAAVPALREHLPGAVAS